jgi:hypothetical protein
MVRLGKLALPVIAAALFSAGCASTPSPGAAGPAASTGSNLTGESTSKRAVETFMRAVKAQDLQQMATAWGTAKGPARDLMSREELEKRLIIMQCNMSHDGYSFLEAQPRLQTGGRHEYLVEIRKDRLRAKTTFTTVPGPSQRWYVEIVDMAPLRDFCS